MNDDFEIWREERNKAVESMNLERFKEFYNRWRKEGFYTQDLPNDFIIEIAMRQMALAIVDIPLEVKKEARKWLRKNHIKVSF